MAAYDAFISYSHAKDRAVAAALQAVKQKLGKPWYRRRALRVFRDDTSLAATPQLWTSIELALSQSRYLVLLASPESAASPWVGKEVAYWLEHKSVDTLLIAVTDGTLAWDYDARDFYWTDRLPLPAVLRGRFAAEPKWVDLSAFRASANPRDRRFVERGADFAAAIHGVPKEDLLSQELRQQRRALSLAWSAVGALAVLFGAAAWQWKEAAAQRDRAEAALVQANRNFNAATNVGGGVVEIVRELLRSGAIPVKLAEPLIDITRKSIVQLDDDTPNEKLVELQWRLFETMTLAYLNLPGQGENALELAQNTRALADRLYEAHRERVDYGLLLANSDILYGDALEARGHFDTAIERYRAGRALLARLTDDKPMLGDSRRRLVYVQQRIGDTLRKQGQPTLALQEFEGNLGTARALADSPQAKPDWLRALALAHQRMGDMYREQPDLDQALEQFTAYRNVSQRLVALENGVPNWAWRLDLWIADQRIGDVLLEKGDPGRALGHYETFRKGAQAALDGDPEHGEWQRFSANSRLKVGDALLAQGKHAEALAEYREGARLYHKLFDKDQRPRSQRSLAIAHYSMGVARFAMDDSAGALEEFQTCLAMPIDESARDAQITRPALVQKECADRVAQISKRAAR
jgi:tetratricopeptide (TPR) repeat protein